MIVINVFQLVFLSLGAVQDFKNNLVTDGFTLPFAFLGIIYSLLISDFKSGILAFALLLFPLIFGEIKYIGSADIIIYAGLIARFGIDNIISIILITNSATIAFYFIEKTIIKKDILTKENGIAQLPIFLICMPFLYFIGG